MTTGTVVASLSDMCDCPVTTQTSSPSVALAIIVAAVVGVLAPLGQHKGVGTRACGGRVTSAGQVAGNTSEDPCTAGNGPVCEGGVVQACVITLGLDGALTKAVLANEVGSFRPVSSPWVWMVPSPKRSGQ